MLVLGCGALGAATAELLCRAGVGTLTLVDRDFVDWTNLQRQALYAEADARLALPKAVAAAQRLRAIDASLNAEPVVADVGARELPALVAAHDLTIDGTDNFRTRHLLNEASARARKPWIYGACVGAYGCAAAIVPGETACLRCLQDQLPAAGDSPTCDTVGIIGPAVQLVAAWQVAEALKLLVGDRAALTGELWSSDLWAGSFQRLTLASWRDPACAVCGASPSYPLLSQSDTVAVTLCGRDAVQVRRAAPDLVALARALGDRVEVANEYLLRWRDGEILGTCFKDGRVIVQGVGDAAGASAFCDRWLG